MFKNNNISKGEGCFKPNPKPDPNPTPNLNPKEYVPNLKGAVSLSILPRSGALLFLFLFRDVCRPLERGDY